MIRRTRILSTLLAAMMFCALVPHTATLGVAYADPAPDPNTSTAPTPYPSDSELTTHDENGDKKACKDLDAAKGGVMLGRIVPCLTYTIEVSAQTFTAQMVTWLQPLLYMFLIFTVVMFGLRVLQNEPKIYVHGIGLLIRIAVVAWVLSNLSTYIVPKVYSVMDETQTMVVGAIYKEGDSTGPKISCPIDNFGDDSTPPVWKVMDCVMGNLFGFTMGDNTGGSGKKPSMLLMTSVFGLASGFLFGGAFGITVFMGIVGVLVSVFMMVVRTVTAFLNGYMLACLMLILTPLFLPLIFFKHTEHYFNGIVKNFMAAFIMPMMVTAYSMLALMMYDQMLFAPDSLISSLFKFDNISNALQEPRQACSHPVTGVPGGVRDQTDLKKTLGKPFLINDVMNTLSAANDICTMANFPNLNMKDINAPGYKDNIENQKNVYNGLFEQLIELIVMGWLIDKGMTTMMGIVTLLSSGGTTVSNLMGAIQQNEAGMTQRLDYIRGKAIQGYRADPNSDKNFDTTRGADFLSKTPGVIKQAGTDIFTSIRK